MKLGILGAGQLGRMLSLAAHRLDIEPHVYGSTRACAMATTNRFTVAAWDDRQALARFAEAVDIVTYEVEALPATTVEALGERVLVRPTARALRCFQDRLLEKRTLARLGIPVAAFAAVGASGPADEAAVPQAHQGHPEHATAQSLGVPLVLKSRFGGYDGRGQSRVGDAAQLAAATRNATDLVAERLIAWERELSLVAVRSATGERRYYDIAQNHHEGGILRWSIAPAPALGEAERCQLQAYVDRIIDELDYVGVLAVEFFATPDGFLVNEVAPRVHNSGHWTLDGAATCQFENHVRACMGLPLGATHCLAPTIMINLIGDCDRARLYAEPDARVHLYGKQPRPGRKLGHVNIRATGTELEAEARALSARLGV